MKGSDLQLVRDILALKAYDSDMVPAFRESMV